ncbi:MAG: AarF/UbiB family protein [Pseudomonadota bacterium]
MTLGAIKGISRLADVAAVLVKNGFADLVERLDLPGSDVRLGNLEGERLARRYSVWARLRMVAEDLGPTFVKLGQLMSQRPDLLPKGLVLEFRHLQDRVTPETQAAIHRAVEKSLGRPLGEVFEDFSPEPLASASLAQVHRARRRDDGRWVAVKVRRPGIVPKVEADLALLTGLVKTLNQHLEAVQNYDLPGLVAEIGQHLKQEMDFSLEARNLTWARTRLAGQERLDIPAAHVDLSSPALLVMDLAQGQRVADANLGPEERRELAHLLARTILGQVLNQGFFHADPHPGNLLVGRDANGLRLTLLDWGLVGRLTPRMRYLVGDMMGAVVDRDAVAMVRTMGEMGVKPGTGDTSALVQDVEEMLERVHSVPLSQIDTAALILDLMELTRTHRIRLQVQYALMDKAFLEMEGLCRELDPEFDPVEAARPVVRELWLERWRPGVILRQVRQHLRDGLTLLKDLPLRLDRVLALVERGELGVEFKHKGLGPLTRAIEESSNRVAVGLIVAALIVGSSMIVTTGVEPKLWGLPALGLVGYLISGVVGLWLVWSIFRYGVGKFDEPVGVILRQASELAM